MKLLVCGGRSYTDVPVVHAVLASHIKPNDTGSVVIQGGANGADLIAKEWAYANGIHCAQIDPLWVIHGKAAGPIRNGVMLTLKPDIVVVFPGGNGTADMVKQARAHLLSVLIVKPEEWE